MFPSAFGNDPYLMDPFDRMNRIMSSFPTPMFESPFLMRQPRGMLQLEGQDISSQALTPLHDFGMHPFGMMGGMNNMHHMMRRMQNSMMSIGSMGGGFPSMGNSHSFQSTTIMMQNDGTGPRVIQSSSSSRLGQDGVKETRKSMKDTGTGEMRMSIGHHIHDRAHIIEKAKNQRTGDQEEKQEYINLDEDEAENFNNEWKHKMSSASPRHQHRSVAHHHLAGERSRHGPYSRHGHTRHHRPHAAITHRPHMDSAHESNSNDPGNGI